MGVFVVRDRAEAGHPTWKEISMREHYLFQTYPHFHPSSRVLNPTPCPFHLLLSCPEMLSGEVMAEPPLGLGPDQPMGSDGSAGRWIPCALCPGPMSAHAEHGAPREKSQQSSPRRGPPGSSMVGQWGQE